MYTIFQIGPDFEMIGPDRKGDLFEKNIKLLNKANIF